MRIINLIAKWYDSQFSLGCVASCMTSAQEGRRKLKIKLVEILMAHLISKSGCMGYTCIKMGEVLVD